MDIRPMQNNDGHEFVSAIAKPDTKFIRNPLPVPTRHSRKDMDYDLEVPEYKMFFDYDIKDDDDFDI